MATQGADYFHDFATTSFAGISCAQIWADFALWEAILNVNPDVVGIVEIGTWQGGFSLYLAAQAKARGLAFVTYDAVVPEAVIPGFQRLDVFAQPQRVIPDWGGKPVALLCDGGNKPRELRTFPPLCPPGSVIVAHDWGTETTRADVPEFLEELYGDYCDRIGSASRVFRMIPTVVVADELAVEAEEAPPPAPSRRRPARPAFA